MCVTRSRNDVKKKRKSVKSRVRGLGDRKASKSQVSINRGYIPTTMYDLGGRGMELWCQLRTSMMLIDNKSNMSDE